MEPPVAPDGEVTPAGVDHRAVSLNDVEGARRASVLAYCARICDPDRIAEAADAAFADLRGALEASDPDHVVDLDGLLLETTRDAAAARMEPSVGSRRYARTCEQMPTLLAGRASERLSGADRAGVERHLARCAVCRDLDRRRDEAEQAYRALLGTDVAPATNGSEPFAPEDPEPEVFASRGEPEDAVEDFAGEGPEVVDEPELAEPVDERELAAEPELADDADEADLDEDADDPYDADPRLLDPPEFDPPTPRAQVPSWLPPSEPDRRDRRGLAIISALIVAGVVILAIGLVQLLGADPEKPAARNAAPAARAPQASPSTQVERAPSRTELRRRARLKSLGDRELGPGTAGDDVKALQKLLGVTQTGTFGELTEYAVSQFQSSHGLPATGVADAATKRKLSRRSHPPAQAPAPPAAPDGTGATGTTGQDGTDATGQDGAGGTAGGTSPAPNAGARQPATPQQPGQ